MTMIGSARFSTGNSHTRGRRLIARGVVPLLLQLAACGASGAAPGGSGASAGTSSPGGRGGTTETGGSVNSDSSANGGRTTTLPLPSDASLDDSTLEGATGSLSDGVSPDGRSRAPEAGMARPDGGNPLQEGGSAVSPPTPSVTCGTAYSNPIKALSHDPSPLAKEANTYYLYSTCQTTAGCATSPKMVPFQTSTDLLNWTPGGNAMNAIPAWAGQLGLSGPPDIWAADVHVVNGKAYLYYSVSSWGDVAHSAVGLMTSGTLNPAASGYQWVDQGKVVGAPEGGSGINIIDPDLFIDDDGRWWLVYGSFNAGVRAIELDPATGKAKAPMAPAELTSGLGEGSAIIKNNGYYYLFLSRGTCCSALNSTYEIVYGRATQVTGPYLNRNGGSINSASEHLLPPGSDGNPGQGGQSFFKENDQMYMVYHAYQPPAGDPTLNIRPIYFDANDWITLDPCKAKGYRP
jgi:arabinan endo-1,5-alpha-L-arabinosidase